MARPQRTSPDKNARPYKYPEADSPMRPDVGTQAQFRKKKTPATHGCDSSLSPAFLPRTGAWENIKRVLMGTYEDTVWDHLAGTKCAPFSAGECGKIAVEVIDDRGNCWS